MSNATEIADIVRALIQAENKHGKDARDAASPILAKGFLITRNSGEEQNRDKYLGWLVDPNRPEHKRSVSDIKAVSDALPVFRSIVTVDGTAKYRNLHVFAIEGGVWKCVAWQVTALSAKST